MRLLRFERDRTGKKPPWKSVVPRRRIPRWARKIFKRPVIAVGSGKGGTGKTTVACSLASYLAEGGMKVGLVDSDIHTPNADVFFGVDGRNLETDENMLIVPMEVRDRLYLMSVGNFVPQGTPILWREEKVVDFLIKSFTSVSWPDDLDLYVVDLPPGSIIELETLKANFQDRLKVVLVTTNARPSIADCMRMREQCRTSGIELSVIVENFHGRYGGDDLVGELAEGLPIVRLPDYGGCDPMCDVSRLNPEKVRKIAELLGVIL